MMKSLFSTIMDLFISKNTIYLRKKKKWKFRNNNFKKNKNKINKMIMIK